MRELLTNLLSNKKCKNFQVVPSKIKDEHPELISKDVYKADEWTITTSNNGAQEPINFYRLYCYHCHTVLLPKLLLEYKDKLGENANVDTLIANWDILKIPLKHVDYIGCFLPWNSTHFAGPTARKYIRDQAEHPKTSHRYTVEVSDKKRHKKQALVSTRPSKVLSVEKPSTSSKQSVMIGKGTKKTRFLQDRQLFVKYTANWRMC